MDVSVIPGEEVLMDGLNKYNTIDILEFRGLYADKEDTSDQFPTSGSPYQLNLVSYTGILASRKGRLRINDTAYGNKVTSLVSYLDRNNVEHLVFSIENSAEGLETLDGSLKVESNIGLRKPLEAVWSILYNDESDYIYDMKIRNDYVYFLTFNSLSGHTRILKYSKEGVYQGAHLFSDSASRTAFDIDEDESIYIFKPDAGTEDSIEQWVWGGTIASASVVLATGVGATAYYLLLNGQDLYVAYYTDGGDDKIDRFNLSLVLQANLLNLSDTLWTNSISLTDNGTIFVTRRNSAGTTRELRYWDGASWDAISGFFGNLPTKVVCREDKIYLAFVDDTLTGASQAAFYVYDIHWNYLERMGNVYLSAATKNKAWDITSVIANETASVEAGRILFDLDDEHIFVVDGIADTSYTINILTVIKKFRR